MFFLRMLLKIIKTNAKDMLIITYMMTVLLEYLSFGLTKKNKYL